MKRICLLLSFLLFGAYLSKAQTTAYPADITVALDGSANFKTIQEAINSVRDYGATRVTIHIKKGVYHEKLVIPKWKVKIALIGEDKDSTIVTWNDYSGKPVPGGVDFYGRDKFSTFTSYTVLVQGNDFEADNLTIENSAGRVGQAVALHVDADRCAIKNCKLLGNQDTLYTAGENCRQYYKDCVITGTTDFIFGDGTALFQNCIIISRQNSYITAASTAQGQPFGFVLMGCKLIPADSSVTKVFLGRPWRSYARTVYINCEMGGHIIPEGWNPWKGDARFPDKEKTAFYAEYMNTGPGSATENRVTWSHQLTADEAKEYTLRNIFAGTPKWDPTK